MPKTLFLALAAAVVSGLAIGVQSSLNSAAGKVLGATLTGLLVNFVGGIAAGLLLAVVYSRQGAALFAEFTPSRLGVLVISGLLGIGIIAGIAYALPRVGVAAGLSSVIAGQMVVALLVDTFGLAGGPPIPLDWSRVAGLGLLALGTWAILPKG